MFHLILAGITLVSGDPEPTRAVYDTLHIAFEKNTDNILDQSRENIYLFNPEIIRALKIKIFIPDYTPHRELSLINQIKLYLKKFLTKKRVMKTTHLPIKVLLSNQIQEL